MNGKGAINTFDASKIDFHARKSAPRFGTFKTGGCFIHREFKVTRRIGSFCLNHTYRTRKEKSSSFRPAQRVEVNPVAVPTE